MILRTTIDLADSNRVNVQLDGNGECASLCKTISRADYIRLISRKNLDDKTIHIPRLPQGTLDVNWCDKDNFSISVFVPGEVRSIPYMTDDNELSLPFPNLLFFFSVKQGVMLSSRVFAVREGYRNICDETELCHFPYGNVYPDGKICWGHNDGIANLKNGVKDIEKIVAVFFNAIMNNDLYNREKTGFDIGSLEQLIGKVVSLSEFPAKKLLKAGIKYEKLGFSDDEEE